MVHISRFNHCGDETKNDLRTPVSAHGKRGTDMKRKSTLFLLLTTLLLIAFLVPACQKKYELDDQALLQLQCNASDAESIIDDIGETSETTIKQTETEPSESSEPTVSETTEATETTEVSETTKATTVETTKATTVETTIAPTPKPTATPTYDPSIRVTPVVTVTTGENSVTVSWNKITGPFFSGYKVVASVSDSTPMYSENGYYAWITDANVTSCTINNGDGYYNGDVGCFSGGTSYYFSVTAIYNGGNVAGNAVQVTMPGAACTPSPTPDTSTYVAPVVTAVARDLSVIVSWNKITHPDLVGYKVVASVSNSTPMYPGDGHYTFITDANITSCTIKDGIYYSDGEFRNFSGGVSYYFSVTAVYNEAEWQYVAGNAVLVRMPSQDDTVGTYPASNVISAAISDGKLNVSWSGTTAAGGFEYYKVVVSKTNNDPMYPADGYWAAIDDSTCTSSSISMNEHTDIISGDVLYIRITTLYQTGIAHGAVVKVTVP